MNVSQLFIRRPVMTVLVMCAICLFGILGYRLLPISDLPNVDFPTIVVSATLPGASPETVASSVATPLEQQFSAIAGIESMNSTSSLGLTQITLQFSLDRDIDSAAQDVQSAISQAMRNLPEDMPSPPTFRKINPSASPILYLALSSKTLPLYELNQYAETMLAQQISMVSGVAEVNVFGSQKYAIRVQMDPDILHAYQLSLSDIVTSIQQGNVNLPTGSIEGENQSFLIKAEGQLKSAEEYRPLIVTYRNGAPVRLDTLGRVIDSVQNDKVASWLNDTRAIILAINRQPGTNTIKVVEDIKKILPQFELRLPKSVNLAILYDRSKTIRASVNEAQFTLYLAAVLVILVIFLFLRNVRATLIPGIALPLSIVGTFAVMYQLNFSLNNISLLGLTLIVGYVVDDAIVMLENIFRYKEQGATSLNAALKGSQEISFTIISMTLSLAVVFIPVLFMGGILGRLLHEFGITIVIAILFSGFISLTLTPMMSSLFLTKINNNNSNSRWITYFGDVLFPKLTNAYKTSLQWTLKNQIVMLLVFIGTIILSIILFIIIPKGFIPNEDTGQIFAYTEADSSVSFAEMSKRQQKVADIIRSNPNVISVMSSVGMGGASTTQNAGRFFISLKPKDERDLPSDEIMEELRNKIIKVPGIRIYFQNLASINIGPLSKSQYQYTLRSNNIDELNHWASVYLNEISKIPGTLDVTSDLQYTGPQIKINIDRNKASSLGVSAQSLQRTLQYAYGSQQVSTIYTTTDDFQVILELDPKTRLNPDMLSKLYVHAINNKLIPISTLATITTTTGPLTINHKGQLPAVTISFNLKPNFSLGSVVEDINHLKSKLNPPATLILDFQGSAQAFQSSVQSLGMLLLFSILVIYILLGILYESFIHPLTILSGLPSAAAGALLTLLIFRVDLNFYSFVGIIMLVGIVKKNAIMMIDFALAAQRRQLSPQEAIYQACLIRFRPIMMTTFAALMGTLPIVLAWGTGAESRRPLGIAVLGGLLLSQLLTLFITPVVFLYFDKLQGVLHKIRR